MRSIRIRHRNRIAPSTTLQPPALATVTTSGATGITDTQATLHGTVNPNRATTSVWFEYGPTSNYGSQTTPVDVGTDTSPVAVSVVLSGLPAGTLVYWRLVASNAAGVTRSSDQTLVTDTVPLVVSIPADAIDTSHATLHATVNPNGADTLVHFEYGATTAYGTSTSAQDIGSGSVPVTVSAPISGLAGGSTYHWRVVAVNSIGTSTSVDATLATTPAATAPTVTAGAADQVDATHATLHAQVTPNLADAMVHFEYGPTNAYGTNTAPVDAGTGAAPVALSAALSGLPSGATTHWRCVAVNSSGTTNSPDQTFQTQTPVTPPVVAPSAATAIDTTHATLHANVNPGGANTSVYFEYGPTIAYGTQTPTVTIPAGASNVAQSAALSGLPVGATTHWRCVAQNSAATTTSADQSFATLANPSSVTPLAHRRGVVQYQSPSNNLDSRAIAAAKPWLNGVTIGARWNQIEAVRGTFDWGNAVASFTDAYANGYFVLLRVVGGRYTPSHVFSTGGVPSVMLYSDPSIANGSPDVKLPVFWQPAWQTEVQRFLKNGLMPLLKTKIPGTAGQGGSAADGSFVCGDLCLGVPIFIGSDPGSEMWLNADGDGTRNAIQWDAVTAQGSYASKVKARQAYMGQVWSAGIDMWVAQLNGLCPALMAFGGVFFDSEAQAHAISKTKLGGANADLVIGMHTDFIPNIQGAPNGTVPQPHNDVWSVRDPSSALNLSQVRASGGAIAFQTASWSGGPNQYIDFTDPAGAYQYGMQNDLLINWAFCRFIETQSNPFGIPALVSCLRDTVQPALVAF